MTRRPAIRNADLRGATRLATDATAGLADLVEALHERIARLPGMPAPAQAGRTGGITGLVYQSIRGVVRVVGGSLDALLGLLAPALEPGADAAPQREALVAALNGVLGDYLVASANPLATPMTLRHAGQALPVPSATWAEQLPGAWPTALLLVHGLSMNDLQWQRNGHDHGEALGRALGFTPVYLRYNSGLHVSINARALARQLEQLHAAWPQPLQRLVLLGHSMGGLLLRSALHHGRQAGHSWPALVSDMLFLGTPHHGAPLERIGNGIDALLGATPYAAPFARLGKLRSAGITDLRHGNLLDEDWVGRDRFAHRADRRLPVPLPSDVRCYAVATSIGRDADDLKGRLLGDGLVPLDSALGRHADAALDLAFDAERRWVGYGIHHLDQLSDPQVYAQLLHWLRPAAVA